MKNPSYDGFSSWALRDSNYDPSDSSECSEPYSPINLKAVLQFFSDFKYFSNLIASCFKENSFVTSTPQTSPIPYVVP